MNYTDIMSDNQYVNDFNEWYEYTFGNSLTADQINEIYSSFSDSEKKSLG